MGCSYINQKEHIKSDLIVDISNLQYEETCENIIYLGNKTPKEAFKFKEKALNITQIKDVEIKANVKKDPKVQNEEKELIISGPIINLLRRKVDNYKKKLNEF